MWSLMVWSINQLSFLNALKRHFNLMFVFLTNTSYKNTWVVLFFFPNSQQYNLFPRDIYLVL